MVVVVESSVCMLCAPVLCLCALVLVCPGVHVSYQEGGEETRASILFVDCNQRRCDDVSASA